MASDAFMEIETRDVIGEALDDRFGMQNRRQGAFEIANFTFSAEYEEEDKKTTPQAAQPPSTPGGGQFNRTSDAGDQKTPKRGAFSIKKPIDKASTQMLRLCVNHTPIDWGIVTLREAGDETKKPWLVIEFRDLYVESFTWDVDPNAEKEQAYSMEGLSFSFGKIMLKYFPQNATGGHGPMLSCQYNYTNIKEAVEDMGSENW